MPRMPTEEVRACDVSSEDVLRCYVCESLGPFGRALQCGGSKTVAGERRHTFILCRSAKCETKFAKETALQQRAASSKVHRKIVEMNKKGQYHCPQCGWDLKDIDMPEVEHLDGSIAEGINDEEPPLPPPPPCVDRGDVTEQAIDLPLEECVLLVKEEGGDEKMTGGKKNTKKVKKQGTSKLQHGLVQALFFEAPRAGGRHVTDEGEILEDDVPSVTQSPSLSPMASKSPTPKLPTKDLPPLLLHAMSGSPWPEMARAATRTQDEPSSERLRPETAQVTSQAAGSTKRPQLLHEAQLELPWGWRTAHDPATKDHYFWNVHTREVTWDHPGLNRSKEEKFIAEQVAAATNASIISNSSSTDAVNKASSDVLSCLQPKDAPKNVVEYVCVRSWRPRPEDRDCIRVTQGERVALESEALDGWAKGIVVPEPGEEMRKGHFPRWALSDNPAPEPRRIPKGSRVKVVADFSSASGGYLIINCGEELDVKYQVEPYVWCWAEDHRNHGRRGWVPESVLQLIE